MRSIWFRSIFLILLGVLLGAAANLLGPRKNRLPWIREPQGTALPGGMLEGDLSTAAMRMLAEKGTANILDARRGEDYAKGHIQGAISLDVREFDRRFPEIQSRLLLEFPIVIYCGGGDCEDSKELAKRLKPFGHEALIFSGGWEAWTQAKLPFEQGESP